MCVRSFRNSGEYFQFLLKSQCKYSYLSRGLNILCLTLFSKPLKPSCFRNSSGFFHHPTAPARVRSKRFLVLRIYHELHVVIHGIRFMYYCPMTWLLSNKPVNQHVLSCLVLYFARCFAAFCLCLCFVLLFFNAERTIQVGRLVVRENDKHRENHHFIHVPIWHPLRRHNKRDRSPFEHRLGLWVYNVRRANYIYIYTRNKAVLFLCREACRGRGESKNAWKVNLVDLFFYVFSAFAWRLIRTYV